MRSLPDVKLISRHKSPGELRADIKATSLQTMIRLLPSDQRRLVEMVIINRQSHRAAAAELRIAPGGVTRRIQLLRNRLACPVRRALAEHLDTLPDSSRSIAVEHFFAGVPRTVLATKLGISVKEVQAQLDYVRGWIRALNRRRLADQRALLALRDGDESI